MVSYFQIFPLIGGIIVFSVLVLVNPRQRTRLTYRGSGRRVTWSSVSTAVCPISLARASSTLSAIDGDLCILILSSHASLSNTVDTPEILSTSFYPN